ENEDLGQQEEREFSVDRAMFLSKEERIAKHGEPATYFMGDGVKLERKLEIEDGTNVLYENYCFSLKGGSAVIKSQIYYSSYKSKFEDLVEDAIKEIDFGRMYAAWSEGDRTDHWACLLYQLRRQSSENLTDRNNVFNSEVLSKMKEVDGDVERLIPLVIAKLSSMEQDVGSDSLDLFSLVSNWK
ncbi:hypothetical protein A3759_18625, partial [Thalassolituus sp. HI0120]